MTRTEEARMSRINVEGFGTYEFDQDLFDAAMLRTKADLLSELFNRIADRRGDRSRIRPLSKVSMAAMVADFRTADRRLHIDGNDVGLKWLAVEKDVSAKLTDILCSPRHASRPLAVEVATSDPERCLICDAPGHSADECPNGDGIEKDDDERTECSPCTGRTPVKVVVMGPNLRTRDAMLHAHAAGCADLRHYGPGRRYGGDANDDGDSLTVTSRREVVEIEFGNQIEESAAVWTDYADEVKFFACLSTLPKEA